MSSRHSFTLAEFYQRFVVATAAATTTTSSSSSWPQDINLLSTSQLKKLVVQFLTTVGIGPSDVKLTGGVNGKLGRVEVSDEGIVVLSRFMHNTTDNYNTQQQQKHQHQQQVAMDAVVTIQRWWRRRRDGMKLALTSSAAATAAVPLTGPTRQLLKKHFQKISSSYQIILQLHDKKKVIVNGGWEAKRGR